LQKGAIAGSVIPTLPIQRPAREASGKFQLRYELICCVRYTGDSRARGAPELAASRVCW